jgi:hypothetical protein
MNTFFRAAYLLLVVGITVGEAVVVNVAGPLGVVEPGATVSVEVVLLNPAADPREIALPAMLAGRLSADDAQQWPVNLVAAVSTTAPLVVSGGGFEIRQYTLILPAAARGRLFLEIAEPWVGRVALEVRSDLPAMQTVRAPLSPLVPRHTVETEVQRTFTRRFSAHEPIYFIYGDESQAAKFQFSFRYRLSRSEPSPA